MHILKNMEQVATNNTDGDRIALPSALTIDTVEAVTAELVDKVRGEAGQVLVIDASALESITTPGVQLLISVHKTLSDAGGHLKITGSDELLRAVFKQIGLAPVYSMWADSNA